MMSDYNWKPVDDRHPVDRELVACKCGDGSVFLGFCVRPYADCGSIKKWYCYAALQDHYRVSKSVVAYCKFEKKEGP